LTDLSSSSTPEPTSSLPGVLRRVAAAFAYRDFRVLWFGAFTSSVGTWMQAVAQSWLVLTLTGSALFLGLDAFLGQLPIMLFTLIGGVVADRRDRRLLLLISQCVQMASAFTLAGLVFANVIRIWHILCLSFISGCAQAFGGPAYQSLVPSLVEKKDLTNAIALNSIQFNLAGVVGPMLAGIALATVGTVACFTLNGLSFLAVIVALLSLHVTHTAPATSQPMLRELRGGLSYVWNERTLFALTVLAFATTFLGTSLRTLLPLFAQNVFHGGVRRYSQMMVFVGAGAVVGALFVAGLGRARRMGRTALIVQVVYGVLIVGFAASRTIWLSDTLLFLAGSALMIVFSSVTSLVQLIVPNQMRGRVMSIYMLAFRGGMPLGALASGYVATLTSAPVALAVNGTLLAMVALWFLNRNERIRAI
jgi:MFS family permease